MSNMINPITVSPTAYNRIEEVRLERGVSNLYLRLSVSGGGCSGFRYDLDWDDSPKDEDIIIDDVVLIDEMSAPLLTGSTIDFTVSLMGENFKVINPNATSGCGCGESFSV
ncbi:MAG: iron-sulfur cluster assembly accessory protein [Alphaproteobacteria bacterium]|nr:iron-sulfur cluster assembly accessory protein [Alphaproteobacteria bacterium]